MKIKSHFFKVIKIDKPLARLIRKKRVKTQTINFGNKKHDITIKSTDIKKKKGIT